MKIVVNGETLAVDSETTLGMIVDGLGRGRAGIAAARNDDVVPRSQWDDELLVDGDHIELLTAAQGG